MSKEFEYFNIARTDSALICSDKGNPDYMYENGPIENPELMKFALQKPLRRQPIMADYHSEPKSIISKKIFDVLAPLNIEGIQLLPSRIRGLNDKIFLNYWAIHIYNRIQCVDLELSNCLVASSGLRKVKKIILDKKILKNIPLKNRLVFRLKEDSGYQLFHISIVESILAVKPEGLRFINIEDWHDGVLFEK